MNRVHTDNAPKAVGPYSQAVSLDANQKIIFVSGQLPVDPKTGQFVDGNIQSLTKQVINNIEAILKSAGSNLQKVVRTEVFMIDLKEFTLMNEVYAQHFNGNVLPARQTIQVAALPMGARIEISCIAII